MRLTICKFCGDALHSFIEELEIGLKVHLVICPTCYKTNRTKILGFWAKPRIRGMSTSGQRVLESFSNSAMKPNEKVVIRNYEY